MGKILAASLILFLAVFTPLVRAQGDSSYEPFSPDQLDNLLAPIALYPDPLLAQVLVAATFPDQIDEASRFVREYRNADAVDSMQWDVSVKAVAHYPTVLAMMADKLDWTTALGQAYAYQSTDVMASVQRLRAQAASAGNLVSTPQMQVVNSGGEIEIWPAQPQYLYVPVYDPAVVYFHRTSFFFGLGFAIGAWLNYDFDWREHHVFYHGWEGNSGWIGRSRQYIHPNNFYVNNNYRTVVINRPVVNRQVNYRALNRYDDVHRTTNFDNFRSNPRVVSQPPPQPVHITAPRVVTQPAPQPTGRRVMSQPPPQPVHVTAPRVVTQPAPEPVHMTVPNKIITRNINTTDPKINEFRGHVPQPQPQVQVHAPVTPAFTPVRGGLDPRVTSQRGQVSRALVRPTPPPVVRPNVVKQPPRPAVSPKKDKNDGNKH
ncbi:MAG: DUF3300 domain-containing protein [Thermoanaerobaculales bacterium]